MQDGQSAVTNDEIFVFVFIKTVPFRLRFLFSLPLWTFPHSLLSHFILPKTKKPPKHLASTVLTVTIKLWLNHI